MRLDELLFRRSQPRWMNISLFVGLLISLALYFYAPPPLYARSFNIFLCGTLAVYFWREQRVGYFRREGDPHLFWSLLSAAILAFGLSVFLFVLALVQVSS